MGKPAQTVKFIVNPPSDGAPKKRRRSSGAKAYKYMLRQAMLKPSDDVLARSTRAKAYIKAAGKRSTPKAVNAMRCALHHYITHIAREAQSFMNSHKRLTAENILTAIRNEGSFFKCAHKSRAGTKDMRRFCAISLKGRAPTPKETEQFLKTH